MASDFVPKALDPTSVKALITTKWAGTSYITSTIRKVEAYSISTNIDSDSDPWSLDLGNPEGDLNALLPRDNEVRVEVFGAAPGKAARSLLKGLTDDVSFSENGTIILSGRDMSCIAVDSIHFPNILRMNPIKIIEMEARQIQVATKFRMRPINGGPSKAETDGSETYWEFWYRLVRKDGRWLWMTPDGTLWEDELNFDDSSPYSFASVSVAKGNDVPVESFEWHKTTQGRIFKLGVEWASQGAVLSTGKARSVSIFRDTNIRDWVRKPNKLIQDKHATSRKNVIKIGNEEIFESRVGAVEIVLTVGDPGYLIQQNKLAKVNIPEYGIKGEWYIVGTTIRGDSSGFVQDVRLREKKFAVSARVPDDPVWTKDPTDNISQGNNIPTGSAATAINSAMNGKFEWYDCFLTAAQKWHGKYDLALFMATLMAICDHETHFSNVRSQQMADGKGHATDAPGEAYVVWHDIRKDNPTPEEYATFKQNFGNTGGDGVIPAGWACAVGPMQLFSDYLKVDADRMNGGAVNELFGNRWDPCSNIYIAAMRLNQAATTTTGSEGDLWAGVCQYGGYSDPNCGYGVDIANRVHNDPGYLALVQAALGSSQAPAGGGGSQIPSDDAASFAQALKRYADQGLFNDDNGQIYKQIDKIAKGQPLRNQCGEDVYCDPKTVGAMCYLIQNGFGIGLFAICEDHSCYVSGTTRKSAHSAGKAFDISSVKGPTGWYFMNQQSNVGTNLAIQVMELLKNGGWLLPSQIICNGVGVVQSEVQRHQWNDGPTNYITDDHIDHIHVGY